ncbi:hypothetical protein PsorP6_012048 [Peronosclerospora sorghi]|uniref:Uncharacterized protein n=1 Tax=Peronosclerospora sorghi TaxID=230839 RepID=A0ACC0WIA0_9STRA|nr:hypothetical protein PsorP6_012048 [Peronosclerospora sorghi]
MEKYLYDLSQYHHEDQQEILVVLSEIYEKNKDALLRQFVEAKRANRLNEITKQDANKLKDMLFQHLVDTRDLRGALAFVWLAPWSENIHSSSASVNFCMKLMDAYMMKFPEAKVKLITTLSTRFGHTDVALTIRAGKSNPNTRAIAEKLESVQREMWLNRGFTPDRVYESLKLSESEADFSTKQLLEAWLSYVDYYYDKKSRNVDEFFTMLEEKFADKPTLGQILEIAKSSPKMEAEAAKLQKRAIVSE